MTDWMYQASSAQAELETLRARMERLEMFYLEARELCLHHDVVRCTDGNVYASVSPRKLGDALTKVNPEWYDAKKYI